MKKAKICLALLIICGILFALVYSIQTEIVSTPVSYGGVYEPQGTWTVETQDSRPAVLYAYDIPQREGGEEQVLFLRTHWMNYDVYVDDTLVFAAGNGMAGACVLVAIPQGRSLTIRFYYEAESAVPSIEQSTMLLGEKSAMSRRIIRDSLYAVVFSVLALVMGVACVAVGLATRNGRFGDISASLAYLGAYVLCAGVWILTDSKLLVLITQRTGLMEMVSFLAFFTMPIPLMGFTGRTLPDRRPTFGAFQLVFALMLLLYVVNEIVGFVSYVLILAGEHLCIFVAILVMLFTGLREMHRQWDMKLHRIVMGYAVLCVCSMMALVFFYKRLNTAYAMSYVLGILGFVCFLADAVWVALYDQMQERANMALYAKMAYVDAMTGLGNRAAFLEVEKENRTYPNSLAYIMVDANNLKQINDTLGHQKGDDLLVRIAQCITRAVGASGKCFRIGGDEFVVCLKDLPREAVTDCAQAIQRETEAADAQSDFRISVAIGHAWTEKATEEDMEQLLREADDAMYEVKKKMKGDPCA